MNLFLRKKGFTLIEIIVVCTIFATMMIGIIVAINRAYLFVDNTRMSVRATNFAREGMEMMYNLRDTNWRRSSGDRDKYWLARGDVDNNGKLKEEYFGEGVYTLKEGKIGNNSYFYAKKLTCEDVEKFYSDDFWSTCDGARSDSELLFTGNYFFFSGDVKTQGEIKELMGQNVRFYRIVRVFGIYKKDVDNSNTVASADEMKDGTPVEMRFCVKVFYEAMGGKHSSELCSIMTNFME